MRAEVQRISRDDVPRVVQLLGKTNQFNLTTQRHTAGDLQALLDAPRSVALSLRLADRFGDYGLIAVVLGVDEPGVERPTLRVDTWLMSCRAIARGVEAFTLNHIVAAARALGYEALLGEYIPTAKNALVADLYDKLGFARVENLPGARPVKHEAVRYLLESSGYVPRPTAVTDR